MQAYPDPNLTSTFLDSCAFEPKVSPEHEATQRIRALWQSGEIQLILVHSVKKEVDFPNTPSEVKREAQGMIFTMPTNLTSPESARLATVLTIMTGNGKREKCEADANHVFMAGKYRG